MGATLIRLYKMIYFSIEKQAQEKIMNCTVSNRAYLNFVTIDSRIFLYIYIYIYKSLINRHNIEFRLKRISRRDDKFHIFFILHLIEEKVAYSLSDS